MKKTSILALTAIMALGLASCNRQEIDPPREGVQGKYLLTEITASTGDDDTKTALQSSGVVNWSAGDQIAVKGTDGELHYYMIKIGADTPVGTFLPTEGQTPASYNSPSDLTAIYPACTAELSGNELFININNQDLSGSFSERGLTSWIEQSRYSFANNDIKIAIPESTTIESGKLNFKFKQLGTHCSFVFDFTQAEQAASLKIESIERIQVTTLENVPIAGRAKVNGTTLGTISSPQTFIDLTLETPAQLSSLIKYDFVLYPKVTVNNTLKITITTTEHEFVFTGKPTQDFAEGKSITFPITVDRNFTIGGTKLAYTSSLRTGVEPFYYYGGTNCLLLRSENEIGYLDVTQYVTDSYWHNTKNTADVQTPRPAAYAKIIWSEASDVIASATVNGSAYGYKLKMAESAAGATDAISTDSNGKSFLAIKRGSTAGNALVGVYDASDELLWSYHIWCPTEDPTAGMYEYTETNSGSYTVMTMPIGAIIKAYAGMSNPQDAAGFYYQWGRKDPLGRPTSYTASNGQDIRNVFGPDQSTALNVGDAVYGVTGGNLRDCEIWFAKKDGSDTENKLLNEHAKLGTSKSLARFILEYSISKPWMFIKVSGVQNESWVPIDLNLWGNPNKFKAWPTMAETYKTIFDPSPEGFRVPPQDLWVGFTKSHASASTSATGDALTEFKMENFNISDYNFNRENNARGYAFYYQGWKAGSQRDFYLVSGCRFRANGNIIDLLTYSVVWSSSINANDTNSSCLRVSNNDVSPHLGNLRGNANAIRCVKEQ